MASWTDATGRRITIATTGISEVDRRAMQARLPDLLADLRQSGNLPRLLTLIRERQDRIERQ